MFPYICYLFNSQILTNQDIKILKIMFSVLSLHLICSKLNSAPYHPCHIRAFGLKNLQKATSFIKEGIIYYKYSLIFIFC